MTLSELLNAIEALCRQEDLDFAQRCGAIADIVSAMTRDELLAHLDDAGVIPERFDHDSTEEKLFAKYCDALVARSLAELGMEAQLIAERSDAADVIATHNNYKLVGDAKAFRLSRTAKNQKDFKVEALNQWRKGAQHACLVSPLYQYPVSSSQIYHQARTYNVALLSYTHLAFLLRHKPVTNDLRLLWDVAHSVQEGKAAGPYWAAVASIVNQITNTTAEEWDQAVEAGAARLPAQAAEQIAFWEAERARIMSLPIEAARLELVAALKIESKIAVIRRAAADLQEATETFET